jgi:hypothetical protein
LVDRNNPRPDRRTTLFWKPGIVSNGYKKTELVFYSSDVQGKFQIKIEGITEAGIPFYTTSFLDVQ